MQQPVLLKLQKTSVIHPAILSFSFSIYEHSPSWHSEITVEPFPLPGKSKPLPELASIGIPCVSSSDFPVPQVDNSISEQGDKEVWLFRKKGPYFLKPLKGAAVWDLFMSMIHTWGLNKINLFVYLTAAAKPPVTSMRLLSSGCHGPTGKLFRLNRFLIPADVVLRSRQMHQIWNLLITAPRYSV